MFSYVDPEHSIGLPQPTATFMQHLSEKKASERHIGHFQIEKTRIFLILLTLE